MVDETWKPIKGYEGLYEVSNKGNVASLNYRKLNYRKELTPKKNNYGYLWVELRNNGKTKQMLIHRLVADAFIENKENYPVINHLDENPLNNCVDNLEWCTMSHNVRYSQNLHPERYEPTKRNCKTFAKKVIQFDKDGNIVRIWDSLSHFKNETGKNDFGVRECCNGNRKTAYGYRWQFA